MSCVDESLQSVLEAKKWKVGFNSLEIIANSNLCVFFLLFLYVLFFVLYTRFSCVYANIKTHHSSTKWNGNLPPSLIILEFVFFFFSICSGGSSYYNSYAHSICHVTLYKYIQFFSFGFKFNHFRFQFISFEIPLNFSNKFYFWLFLHTNSFSFWLHCFFFGKKKRRKLVSLNAFFFQCIARKFLLTF